MITIYILTLSILLQVVPQNAFPVLADLSLLEQAWAKFEQSIVNGVSARRGDAPYMVLVLQQLSSTRFRVCGGTLYKQNKVLTAAHCVVPNEGPVYVRYGTQQRSTPVHSDIKASKFVQHPDWNPQSAVNDVAVITLSQNIHQDATVKYATLQNKDLRTGDKVTIYGWGQQSGSNTNLPEQLQKTTLQIRAVQGTRLLASAGGTIACSGDSGSPMASADGKVSGVASQVVTGCPPGKLNYYTKVSYYLNWINSQ